MLVLQKFVPTHALILQRFGPAREFAAMSQENLASVPWVIGPPGPAGVAGTFEFMQVNPLATWTVNHNLGRKVLPQIYSAGGVQIHAEILRISNNQFLVFFDEPTSGSAFYQ